MKVFQIVKCPFFFFSFFLFCLGGCTQTKTTTPGATNAPPTNTAKSGIRFREVAAEAGIVYEWSPLGKRPLTILQTIGNGCAFLDYNNDGNLDILLVGQQPALFQGDGKGKFTNVTNAVLSDMKGYFLGCAVGDYDNDGYEDVYLTGYREGRLLHNEKGQKFADATKTSGIPAQQWGSSASWVDLDRDGKLDLMIANYVDFNEKTQPQLCYFPTADKQKKLLSSCGPKYYTPIKGTTYQNLGNGKFGDKTPTWGMATHTGKGLGTAAIDFDGSGRDSVAVANDEMDSDLFLNEGKDKFRNIGQESGIARDRDGSVHAGMGLDWGDYNNDGKFDLFVTTFRNEAKSLYRNDGEHLFTDVAYTTGVGRPAAPYVSFGTKFLDADNDGWLDILIANGHVQDNIEQLEDTKYRQPLVFLQNQSAGGQSLFTDGSKDSGVAAVPPLVGRGLAVGDYDNDGRMDALVTDNEGKPVLLHNETESPSKNHYMTLALVGTKSNKSAHGALVEVTLPDGKKLLRHCQTDGSYMSASDPRVHFGLGAHTKASVTVTWPSGSKEAFPDVAADKVTKLTEK
jgi:enediyne biosynthesis protein E4